MVDGTGLTGLGGLSSVTTVGEDLRIAGDPSLEQAVAEAFSAGIAVGSDTTVEDSDGPCP